MAKMQPSDLVWNVSSATICGSLYIFFWLNKSSCLLHSLGCFRLCLPIADERLTCWCFASVWEHRPAAWESSPAGGDPGRSSCPGGAGVWRCGRPSAAGAQWPELHGRTHNESVMKTQWCLPLAWATKACSEKIHHRQHSNMKSTSCWIKIITQHTQRVYRINALIRKLILFSK